MGFDAARVTLKRSSTLFDTQWRGKASFRSFAKASQTFIEHSPGLVRLDGLLDSSTDIPVCSDAELLQIGYRYGLSLTHHSHDAEDLVHEAWLNLCRRYGRVESKGLLFTAMRNLFIDQCRRQKIVEFESTDQADPPEIPGIEPDVPGIRGDLDELLAILRPHEREVLFLHYHQGHTAEEIGTMTNQPRGTVLSLLHRSIAKLRNAAVGKTGASVCNQWLLLFVPFV